MKPPKAPTEATHPRSALRVIEGGLTLEQRLTDESVDRAARERLSDDIAEAARLCDRLEADGLRVAFEPGGPGQAVRMTVRNHLGDDVRQLEVRDATDLDRLRELSGVADSA
jgi:hypothetical protein